ncbi:hypothetical protein CGLO_13158 [Colletotrichum gloeosporioides Cg-14]|uniref:Uncharacterized protein n=1 Tax=Colletotrichum gloeosporioides (strain Cg-14) TaxID=1237896 RepID=T0K6R4_COLGC|nr:hypothetical protein CGLO_13158 [Colletotrichum gloeosporioides Cg-14]
MSQARWIGKK